MVKEEREMMKKMVKILAISICCMVIIYAQTVYAMSSEAIAQALNSTFNTEFTPKHIDNLSQKERANLENIAQKTVVGQLLISSGVSGLETKRQEALRNITKVVDALVPDDPLKAGLQKAISAAAGPVVGKADMTIKVGAIVTLLPSLINTIIEKYELPFINIYLQERNNGKTHDDAWKIATTGDNKMLIDAGIPAGLNLDKTKENAKELFESSRLATEGSKEWNQAKNSEVLPRFESAKKIEQQSVETPKASLTEKLKAKVEQAKEKVKEKIEQVKNKVEQLKGEMKQWAASSASINVVPKTILPIAKIDAVKIIEMPKKLPMNLPQGNISDASKLRESTAQEKLTPVNVTFTQTFNGLFTQSADFPDSTGGNHSGTLTDGTRVNVKGDSVAGDFTGSFSGQSVGEPGYTPATHTNSAFSGSSVGTASAKGLKEGDLKGTMTVTIPSGTQTTNVTGNITIKTDGSLSMPSYTGPTTDNATGTKVGTMSGEWNQSKTR